MCGCLLCIPHRGPGLQPGMCPEWERNQRPFGLQARAQSTDLHQQGKNPVLLFTKFGNPILGSHSGGSESHDQNVNSEADYLESNTGFAINCVTLKNDLLFLGLGFLLAEWEVF